MSNDWARGGDIEPCRCLPEVSAPRFRAHLGTGGICIYSVGRTEEEALANLAAHACKDRIPRKEWAEVWLETIEGVLVRDDITLKEAES